MSWNDDRNSLGSQQLVRPRSYSEILRQDGARGLLLELGLNTLLKNDANLAAGSISERIANVVFNYVKPIIDSILKKYPKLTRVVWVFALLGYLAKIAYQKRAMIWRYIMLHTLASVSIETNDQRLYTNVSDYIEQHGVWTNKRESIVYRQASRVPLFKHDGKIFLHTEDESQGELRIWRPGSTAASIQSAITNIDIRAQQEQIEEEVIEVYTAQRQETRDKKIFYEWIRAKKVYGRSLNSVCLRSEVKPRLVKDIDTFLDPARKSFYTTRGLAYHRGYLLYGKPGCGKTSFARAVATHWNMTIRMLSLSDKQITDTVLQGLVAKLGDRDLLLIEDIDSAGLSRETLIGAETKFATQGSGTIISQGQAQSGRAVASKTQAKAPQGSADAAEKTLGWEEPPQGVTLSGLLNVLDGVNSPVGHIVMMTTNTIESLDFALKRDGRFDLRIEFDLACREQIMTMFMNMYEPGILQGPSDDSNEVEQTTTLRRLSHQFAEIVPEGEFALASIQKFLLIHSVRPEDAIEEAANWVIEKRKEMAQDGQSVAKKTPSSLSILSATTSSEGEGSVILREPEILESV